MEITDRGNDVPTVIECNSEQNMGLTLAADESVTTYAQTLCQNGSEEDQLTLYEGNDSEKTVAEGEKRNIAAPKTQSRSPLIKRLFTGEEVLITKPVFCIGRKEDADYLVTHNPAISRKHAEIISRNGRYYIHDLGAKNRTYVNGKLMPAKSESALSNGDVIKLANEDFLVKL